MRIVSWNTQYATTNALSALGQGKHSESEFRAALQQIAALEPDVVAFQEVERGQGRSLGLDQPRIIEQEMKAAGMKWTAFAPSFMGWAQGLRLYPDPKIRDDWPAFGVMLAARDVPQTWKIARLGKAPVRWVSRGSKATRDSKDSQAARLPAGGSGLLSRGLLSQGLSAVLSQGKPAFGETRVLLAAVLPSGHVVGTTHLEIDPPTAKAQARRAFGLLSGLARQGCAAHDGARRSGVEVPASSTTPQLARQHDSGPAILVGDFNLSPGAVKDALNCDAALDAGLGADFNYLASGRVNVSARTYPTVNTTANMDQAVLEPGFSPQRIIGAGTLPLPVSDHAAFVLDVSVNPDYADNTDAKAK